MANEHDDQQAAYLREMHDFDKHEATYKDELASALLAFNRVESMVSDMVATLLRSRGRDDLIEKLLFERTFSEQLETLELLLSSMLKAPRLPISRLKSIASRRIKFAHGHFTGSVNTGEVYIESRSRSEPWNSQKVKPFLKDCAAARRELEAFFPWGAFGDAPAEPPAGAVPMTATQ